MARQVNDCVILIVFFVNLLTAIQTQRLPAATGGSLNDSHPKELNSVKYENVKLDNCFLLICLSPLPQCVSQGFRAIDKHC